MLIASGSDLLEALLRLGVVDEAQAGRVRGAPPAADARALAKDLMRRGWLTPFQANQLLQGHGDALVFGPYLLLERIGQGGMGEVFKARHRRLGRVVAVKVIRKERLQHPEAVRRFLREVRAAAQLNHPNVVAAYDAEEANGVHFLALEYVEGLDLERRVKAHGPLPIPEACDYVRQAALGLQHAHERGLVHRDVKPSNLLLDEKGVVKVLDLGLARFQTGAAEEDHSSTLTRDGAVMGTPDFMSPEQVRRSHEVDGRADVYSLGCTLFYLLTGRTPFAGGSLGEKLAAHLSAEPPPLRSLRPDAPPALAAVLGKMTAKRPEDRYQTAAEVARALADLPAAAAAILPAAAPARAADTPFANLREGDTTKSRVPAARPARRWRLAGSLALGAVAVLGSAAVVVLLLNLWRPHPAAPLPPPIKAPLSPLDSLSAAQVPEIERFPWQPAELVAVLGNHGLRHWSDGGSGASVSGVAYSPSGDFVASAGDDGTVHLWDAATGRERAALSGYGRLLHVAVAPDGKWLIVCGHANKVFLCEITDAGFGVPVELRHDHPERVLAVAFAPDGRTFASAGADKTVCVWKRNQGLAICTQVLEGHDAGVNAVAFSKEGDALASASTDKTVRLWHYEDGAWKKGASLSQREGASALESVVIAPDGRLLAAGGEDGAVRLWDLSDKSLEPRTVFGAHPSGVHTLAFSPDGATLATGGEGGLVRMWEDLYQAGKTPRNTGGALRADDHRVSCLAFGPEGRSLVTCGGDRAVHIWDNKENVWSQRLPPRGHTAPVEAMAFTADGRTLASVSYGDLFLWRFGEGGPEGPTLRGSLGYAHAALTLPDGKTLVTAVAGAVGLWDLSREKTLEHDDELLHRAEANALAFEPSNRTLAVGCADGAVYLWNMAEPSPRKPAVVQATDKAVSSVAFSPDGKMLAAGAREGGVRLFQLQHKWVDARPLPDRPGGISAVAFAPDGKTLAVADGAGKLHLWDLLQSPPKESQVFEDHAGPAFLAFAPDGKTLASGGADGRLVWRRTDGWEKAGECAVGFPVHSMSFAPDGRHVATGNANGTIYVFRLAPAPP